MMHGEFESMKTIHTLMPDFAPRPIAWGTYKSIPNTYFFLCDYKEMIDELPDPHKFASRLAALHQNSKSPNGKFGFHITTYSGNLPQMNEWEDSWEVYFAKCLRKALDLELEAKEMIRNSAFLFQSFSRKSFLVCCVLLKLKDGLSSRRWCMETSGMQILALMLIPTSLSFSMPVVSMLTVNVSSLSSRDLYSK